MRNVSSPTIRTAVPSENSPTFSSSTRWPASTESDHRVGVGRLHTDDLDLGPDRLDVVGDPRDQTSASHRDEDRVEAALVLAQQLHGDGALPRDHVGIVERVDEREPALALLHQRDLVGVGVALSRQHHLGTERSHGVDLEFRRRDRHDDDGPRAQLPRTQRHALCVVAGRRADDPAGQGGGVEVRHLVVGTAQLEAEDGLLVLALEQHPVAEALAEPWRGVERRLHGPVADLRREDPPEVVGRRQPGCRLVSGRLVGGSHRVAIVGATDDRSSTVELWRRVVTTRVVTGSARRGRRPSTSGR
jgi:hypothetical protein